MKRQNGFTMVELLVSIAIVMVVMAVATAAYMKLLQGYKTGAKASENYISDLCGLELLRQDVEMAGYGLPINMNGNTYNEALSTVAPIALNDAPVNPPRAFTMIDNASPTNSDILAIKSSMADLNSASKKWSMIPWPTTGVFQVKAWGGANALDPVSDFVSYDRFIIMDNSGTLQPAASGGNLFTCYSFTGVSPTTGYYANTNQFAALPVPPNNQSVFFLYGLGSASGVYRMPFNRVDYYLARVPSDFPAKTCAASTYTLYRATINQTGAGVAGTRNAAPVLDCVRDFQVAFGLDTNTDGAVDTWVSNLSGLTTAAQERAQIREVRIFILYHEGTGDVSSKAAFRFSGTLNLGDQDIANSLSPGTNFKTLSTAPIAGSLSSFTPPPADQPYRWKVLELSIKPMNLH